MVLHGKNGKKWAAMKKTVNHELNQTGGIAWFA
jgi:hypothetical protein